MPNMPDYVPANKHKMYLTTNAYDLGWFAGFTNATECDEPAPHTPEYKEWWRGHNDGNTDRHLQLGKV